MGNRVNEMGMTYKLFFRNQIFFDDLPNVVGIL